MKYSVFVVLIAVLVLGAIACEPQEGARPPAETPTATAPPETATEAPATSTPSPERTPTSTPSPTPTPTVEAATTYVVKAGDVCWRIAQDFGIATSRLLEANPRIDENCSNLRVGWELVIPGAGATATSQAATAAASSAGAADATPTRAAQASSGEPEWCDDVVGRGTRPARRGEGVLQPRFAERRRASRPRAPLVGAV